MVVWTLVGYSSESVLVAVKERPLVHYTTIFVRKNVPNRQVFDFSIDNGDILALECRLSLLSLSVDDFKT